MDSSSDDEDEEEEKAGASADAEEKAAEKEEEPSDKSEPSEEEEVRLKSETNCQLSSVKYLLTLCLVSHIKFQQREICAQEVGSSKSTEDAGQEYGSSQEEGEERLFRRVGVRGQQRR